MNVDLDHLLEEITLETGNSRLQLKDQRLSVKNETPRSITNANKRPEYESKEDSDIEAILNDMDTQVEFNAHPPTPTRLMPVSDISNGKIRIHGKTKCGGSLQCKSLKCIGCDFRVLRFPGNQFSESIDYLFLRNYYPDEQKLQTRLTKSFSKTAYCCQCWWLTAAKDAQLPAKWRCSGH